MPAAGGRGRQAPHGPLTRACCLSLQVVLLGMDILSALVTRLQDRFKRRSVQVSALLLPSRPSLGLPKPCTWLYPPHSQPSFSPPPFLSSPLSPAAPPPPPACVDAAPLPLLPYIRHTWICHLRRSCWHPPGPLSIPFCCLSIFLF